MNPGSSNQFEIRGKALFLYTRYVAEVNGSNSFGDRQETVEFELLRGKIITINNNIIEKVG